MFCPSDKSQRFGEIASYLFLDLSKNYNKIFIKRTSSFGFLNGDNENLITIYENNREGAKAIFIEQVVADYNETSIKPKETNIYETVLKNLEKICGTTIKTLDKANCIHFYVQPKENDSNKYEYILESNHLLPSFKFYKWKNKDFITLNCVRKLFLPFVQTALSALIKLDSEKSGTQHLMEVKMKNELLKDYVKKTSLESSSVNKYSENNFALQYTTLKLWDIDTNCKDLGLFLVRCGGDVDKFRLRVANKNAISCSLEGITSKTKFLINNDVDFELVKTKYDIVHEVVYKDLYGVIDWLQSSKETSVIWKYIFESMDDQIDPVEKSLKVISSPAGSGKSFQLSRIKCELQSEDKARWIELVNGCDLDELFCEEDWILNGDTLSILKRLFNVQNNVEDEIFNFNIKISGRLVLLIDDFDHISKKFRTKLLSFLERLFFDYPKVLVWITCKPNFANLLMKTIPIFPHILKYDKDFVKNIVSKYNVSETDEVIEQICQQNQQTFVNIPYNVSLCCEKIKNTGLDNSLYILDVYDFYIEQKLQSHKKQIFIEDICESAAYLFFNVQSTLNIDLKPNLKFYAVFGKYKDRVILEYLTAKYLLNHPNMVKEIIFKKEVESVMNLYDQLQFRHTKVGAFIFNGDFEKVILFAEEEDVTKIRDSVGRSLLYIVDDEYSGFFELLINKGVSITAKDDLTNNSIEFYIDKKCQYKCIDIILKYDCDWTKFKSILNCSLDELTNIFEHNIYNDNYNICKLILNKRNDFLMTPFLVFAVTINIDNSCRELILQALRLAVQQGLSNQSCYIEYYGCSALHRVAQFPNELEIFRILVDDLKYDINLENNDGYTPLFYANAMEAIEIVDYLIKKGANPFHIPKSLNSETLFHTACVNGNLETVKYYINNLSPSTKKFNQTDVTPIFFAVMSRNVELVKYMFENGFANINVPNEDGETPLHYACEYGDFEMVQFLVEHGANVNATKKFRAQRPIDVTYDGENNECLKIYNYLIENGSEFTIDHLFNLLRTSHYQTFKKACTKLNVCWSYKNRQGCTLLHYAALYRNDKDILEFIVKKSDLELPDDENNETALHKAFSMNNTNAIEILLKFGANVHAKSKNGETMMHFAARTPSKSSFNILFDKGLDINQKDNAGKTPVHQFVESGDCSLTTFLLQKGMDVNTQDNEGMTALHNTCRNNFYYATAGVQCCLRDLKIDSSIRDCNRRIALHYAVENDNFGAVQIIAKYQKLDVDAVDVNGETPLSLAKKIKNQEIYNYLCDIKLKNTNVD